MFFGVETASWNRFLSAPFPRKIFSQKRPKCHCFYTVSKKYGSKRTTALDHLKSVQTTHRSLFVDCDFFDLFVGLGKIIIWAVFQVMVFSENHASLSQQGSNAVCKARVDLNGVYSCCLEERMGLIFIRIQIEFTHPMSLRVPPHPLNAMPTKLENRLDLFVEWRYVLFK